MKKIFKCSLLIFSLVVTGSLFSTNNEVSTKAFTYEDVCGFKNLETKASLSFSYVENYFNCEKVTNVNQINSFDSYMLLAKDNDFGYLTIDGKYVGTHNDSFVIKGLSTRTTFRDANENEINLSSSACLKFDCQDNDKSNGVEIEYDSYNLVIANKNVEFDYSFDEDVSIPTGVPYFSGDTDAQKFDSLFDISFLNGKVTICIHGTQTKLGFVKESNLVEDCYFSTVGDNISYDLELFKYLDRPNWTGEHYRRVFDINDIFEENVSHALVAENVLEDDEGHYLDGVFSKSKSFIRPTYHYELNEEDSPKEFLFNDLNFSSFTIEDAGDEKYFVNFDGLGYLGLGNENYSTFEFAFKDSVQSTDNLYKFEIINKNNKFTFKGNFEGKDVYLSSAKNGNSESIKFYIIPDIPGIDPCIFYAYKKIDLKSLEKKSISLFDSQKQCYSDVVSLRIGVTIPAQTYANILANYPGSATINIMYKINNAVGYSRQEFPFKPNGFEGDADFYIYLSGIPVSDFDINIKAYACLRVNVTEGTTDFDAKGLNNGNGYSVNDMITTYINNSAADHSYDQHLDALRYLDSLGGAK